MEPCGIERTTQYRGSQFGSMGRMIEQYDNAKRVAQKLEFADLQFVKTDKKNITKFIDSAKFTSQARQ